MARRDTQYVFYGSQSFNRSRISLSTFRFNAPCNILCVLIISHIYVYNLYTSSKKIISFAQQ